MKPLADFYSRLIPLLPGCPEPTANQAIVDAAIAFCEDSLALREELDVFQTAIGVGQYSLDAVGSQQQVARVMHVSVDGWPVEVVPSERVGNLPEGSGTPRIAYTTRDGSDHLLNLYPTPQSVANVRVVAASRPTRTATQLDDELLNRWVDGVVFGAAARIASIPNQPFSDPQAAAMFTARAISASNKARVDGSYGRVRGQIQVQMRPLV